MSDQQSNAAASTPSGQTPAAATSPSGQTPPAATSPGSGALPLKTLAVLAIPALIIGVVAALVLWALEYIAGLLETYVWKTFPGQVGVDPNSGWWIFGVLTASGIAVGLCVWLVPGHGGRDSATTELIAPPLSIRVLPSLALVTVLALAGGVSLGPENPIIAINVSLLVAVVARAIPRVPTQLVGLMAISATIGALFGTPVAAALVLTGVVAAARTGGALWDRLFLPLVSAGAGSAVMVLLNHPSLQLSLPAPGKLEPIDFVSGLCIAVAATALGLIAIFVFPFIHRFFHSLRNPLLYVGLGGVVLGLLGVLGGPITLFKGLDQMAELVANNNAHPYSAGQLTVITLVKVAALVVAASAGFRGGRIFPAVFIGVAFGLLAHSLIPGVPVTLAVACGVLGVVLAIARDGWLALFIAAAVVGDTSVFPILCILILPIWLMVSRAPEMIIKVPEPARDPQSAAAGVQPATP